MTNKVALVSGASRGFGAACAVELARAGWHIVALARTVGGLEDLDDRIVAVGGASTLVPLDITDDAGLQRMCLSLHERWGRIDLFLHAAIFACPLSPASLVPESDWDKTLAVNIRATQRLIEMTDPLLKAAASGVAILPVDDGAIGQKFLAAYGAAKAAQRAIWDSWAAESARIGPRVTTFSPRAMPTALRGRFYPGEDRSKLADLSAEAARLLSAL